MRSLSDTITKGEESVMSHRRRSAAHTRVRTGLVVAIAALAASAAAASPAAAGGNAGFGCPAGFDIGAVTAEQALALPRIQAGIAAGAYTAEEAMAVFDSIDRNGNGIICVKDVATLTGDKGMGVGSQFLYNGIDDNAAPVAR